MAVEVAGLRGRTDSDVEPVDGMFLPVAHQELSFGKLQPFGGVRCEHCIGTKPAGSISSAVKTSGSGYLSGEPVSEKTARFLRFFFSPD